MPQYSGEVPQYPDAEQPTPSANSSRELRRVDLQEPNSDPAQVSWEVKPHCPVSETCTPGEAQVP